MNCELSYQVPVYHVPASVCNILASRLSLALQPKSAKLFINCVQPHVAYDEHEFL